jgi:hypothetical protein
MDDLLNIKLSVNEWQAVMGELQEGKYRIVAPLMQKINEQATAQIAAQQQQAQNPQPPMGPRVVPDSAC